MMKKFSSSLIFFIVMLFSVSSYADIETENFRIILAPAVAKSTAGYGVIKNVGSTADTLIEISSDAAMVMLHKTEINSGMAQMIHMLNIVIEAGSELVLKPMSYHLMLVDLSADSFKQGDIITLKLEFEKAGVINVEVPIVPAWDDSY
jgi:periplasmic copper chaperone A